MVVAWRLALTLCIVTAGTVTTRADDAATIAAIAERYGKLCDSLVAIDTTFTLTQSSVEDGAPLVMVDHGRRVHDGKKRLWALYGGTSGRQTYSFNGILGFEAHYELEDAPIVLIKTATCPSMAEHLAAVGHWLGLQTPAAIDLRAMLLSPACRIVDMNPYEGEPACRVDLGSHEDISQPGRFFQLQGRFSTKYGGWPVELQSRTRPESAGMHFDYERTSLAWKQFPNPLTGGETWIPIKMAAHLSPQDVRWEFELTEVTLNQSPPDSVYIVDPGPGTEIRDAIGPGAPKVSIHQPEKLIERQRGELERQAATTFSYQGVVSRPEPWTSWLTWSTLRWLFVGSLIGFGVFRVVGSFYPEREG